MDRERERTDTWSFAYQLNPVSLLFIVIGSIFLVETIVMLLIVYLPPISVIQAAVVDALLLSSVLVPLLYIFVYKPLQIHGIYHDKLDRERDRLNRSLSAKNRELEQIVSVTSHDLRSPLVNIDGYGKIIGKSLKRVVSVLESAEISKEAKAEICSIIETDIREAEYCIFTNVSKMQRLLSGLLQVSKLGAVEMKNEIINMNRIMTAIQNSMEYQIQEAGATIEISELPPCVGDASQLNQVFSNLLDNALKYLDPSRPGIIKISGKTDQNHSMYCVEDNGIGIASEHREKIFEIFHQLKPGNRGEGLGLSIVQRIIERHNGTIQLESEKGKGSRFLIYLPKR